MQCMYCYIQIHVITIPVPMEVPAHPVVVSSHVHVCPPEYTGQVCNVTVNPCDSNPCEHGGTCSPGIGLAYTCSCSAGYTGATCAENIDDCDPNPCMNGSICIDGIAQYTCQCDTNCIECGYLQYLNTTSSKCINISTSKCISCILHQLLY